MKKILALLITTLLTCNLFLSGCAKAIVEPDVSAKACFNLVIGDLTAIEDLGVKKIGEKKLVELGMAETRKQLVDEAKAKGATLTDEEVNSYIQVIIDTLKKVNPTFEIVSQSEDSAQVKVTTNTINLAQASETGAKNVPKDLMEDPKAYYPVFLEKVEIELSLLESNADIVEETFEFKKDSTAGIFKKKEYWIPTDFESFTKKISDMIIA